MSEAVAERSANQEDIVEPEISITLASSFQDLAANRDEWDRFVEDSGSDVYFTMDWLQTWWNHYGEARELRCFLMRANDKIVAALPFCITKLRIGPITVRLARWVGSDSTLSVLHPAITRGYEAAALDVICRRLLVDERCDAVSLSPLSGLSSVGKAAQEFCGGIGAFSLVHDDSKGPHIVFLLPDSFEEYLGHLSGQNRSNFRKDHRQLSKHCSLRHEAVAEGDMSMVFDSFVALHEDQWRASGRLGHFRDWPGSEAFNRELVERLASKGRVRCYQLLGDGEVIAMQFGFVLADRYYARLPARRMDSSSERLGVGRVALVENLKAMIGEGIRMVEDGPGHYQYKLRYGGTEYPLRRLVIVRRALSARLKAGILLLWCDAIHLLYYRVWFLKLTPLLRLPARPLRQFWIRSRV